MVVGFNLSFNSRKNSRGLRETTAKLIAECQTNEGHFINQYTGIAVQYARDCDCRVLGQKAALEKLFQNYPDEFTYAERKVIWAYFLHDCRRKERLANAVRQLRNHNHAALQLQLNS